MKEEFVVRVSVIFLQFSLPFVHAKKLSSLKFVGNLNTFSEFAYCSIISFNHHEPHFI